MSKIKNSIKKSAGIIIAAALFLGIWTGLLKIAAADTNIDSVNRWAWNDIIGWLDFFGTASVTVTSQQLTGYAASAAGDISLDCETTRRGDICGQSNYKVTNDGLGNLAGWGWNDVLGWISFCGGQGTYDCPGTSTAIYEVRINPSTGDFRDYAWNDISGWISFCGTPGGSVGCVTTAFPYKVSTSWRSLSAAGSLDSSVYDTGVAGGAQLNSFLWRGDPPAGTEVRFKFAASNSQTGPWNYLGPNGSTSTDDYYGPVPPDTSYKPNYVLYNDQRYFRYRVILISDEAQQKSPRIDDIIINWSP